MTYLAWLGFICLKRGMEFLVLLNFFFQWNRNQFSTSIRILRIDNTLEYVKNDVSIFWSENGIIHQASYSYTSQQNGTTECKHRRILDVARIMMIHMHVPKFLWSNDVLTACYLINKMPSSVLNDTIPFSCLYPDKKCLFHGFSRFWLYIFCLRLVS